MVNGSLGLWLRLGPEWHLLRRDWTLCSKLYRRHSGFHSEHNCESYVVSPWKKENWFKSLYLLLTCFCISARDSILKLAIMPICMIWNCEREPTQQVIMFFEYLAVPKIRPCSLQQALPNSLKLKSKPSHTKIATWIFADTIQSQRDLIQSTMKTDPEMILFKSRSRLM